MMAETYPSGLGNHTLRSGFIEILCMINPFTYHIQCQDCISLHEMNLKLKRIIPECVPWERRNMNMKNLLVIIEDFDKKCYRGYIKYIEEPDIFHVHRIDVGDDISIQKPIMYCLPNNLFQFEAQRHTIKLYGIVPSTNVTYEKLNDCTDFLKKLIFSVGCNKLNEYYLINNCHYGTLEIERYYDNRLLRVCVNDILVEKSIAIPTLNFETVEDGKEDENNKPVFVPEHTFVEKVVESIRKIEITPQHSVYLNALTSGLLINPEYFTDPFLKTEQLLNNSSIIERKEFSLNNSKIQQEYELDKMSKTSVIGHGRICTSVHDGFSGGRGKIKLFMGNLKETKLTIGKKLEPLESHGALGLSSSTLLTDNSFNVSVGNNVEIPSKFLEESKKKSLIECNAELSNSFLVNKDKPDNLQSSRFSGENKINLQLECSIEHLSSVMHDENKPVSAINSARFSEVEKNALSPECNPELAKQFPLKKNIKDSENSSNFIETPHNLFSNENEMHKKTEFMDKHQKQNSEFLNLRSKKCKQSTQNSEFLNIRAKKCKQSTYQPKKTKIFSKDSFPKNSSFPPKDFHYSNLNSDTNNDVQYFQQKMPNILYFGEKTSENDNYFDQMELKNDSSHKTLESDSCKIDIHSEVAEKIDKSDVEVEDSNFFVKPSGVLTLNEFDRCCSGYSDIDISQNRNMRNDISVIKTMGRGLLLRKYSKISKVNDVTNDSNIRSEFVIPQSCDVSEQPLFATYSPGTEHKKDDSGITLKDKNDHEDRYFDIEEPTYLSCAGEYSSTININKTESENIEASDNNDHYEKLLDDTHELLNNKALFNSGELINPAAEQLEQQILRDYSVGQITERMKMSCGLVHGNVSSSPVSKLSELKLEQHIVSNLNSKNMRELSRSQMFAVPVLLQRKNLVLVGPPNSGKTLAYVMSILSLLHDDGYYSKLKPGNGPRCVFVSSCAQNVNYISQFCSAICGAKMTIITTHGGGLEMERKEDLTNGCEILVTTPRCYLRLLKHTSVTNLSRLCHIIFDDTDTLLTTFSPEIQEIMSSINKMLHIRKRYCSIGIQVVFVGEKWTPILEDITFKALDSPVLCITAHLEAALYARIKPKTYILSPDCKLKKLKELLTLIAQKMRTVIVCRCADEVKSLRPLLEPTLSDVLVAHEEMDLINVIEVSDQWVRCTSPPILLCSDLILNELAVTNAQWLIHYSMPDNKTSFSERFSTIKEHIYDRIKYPKTAPPECQVHILVDDSNELQFPEIISFMERLSTPIPELFLKAVKKISVSKEERKIDAPFCENMLMFGKCWKKEKCKRQHIFNKSRDNPGDHLVNGIMKVKLLYTHNPSHYSIRVLATKKSSNEDWCQFPSNYALIAFKMSNYYSSRENRFGHGRVKIGDMVAIEVEPDLLFKRAKVIEIITRDEKLNPEQVIVHFIDEGSANKFTAAKLLYLPSELQIYPQEAYDMFLTGLQPVDYDNAWSFASTLKIQKSISSLNFSEGDNKFFIATVVLVAGQNLLSSSFLCYEWLDLSKCHVVLFSPKKFILDTGLAESNPEHLTCLVKLALEAGLISSFPDDLKKVDADQEKEEIQWAYLDKESCNIIHVISSITPSHFFLRVFKFNDRLDDLEKDLTALLNSQVRKLDVLEHDMFCAARHPNANRWNRAIINYVNSKGVEVFFVDHGDYLIVPFSDISQLPEGFIRRLPFQAIECGLVGILPVDGNWLPKAIEDFDNMCFNDEKKLIPMFAKVSGTAKATFTTGQHFNVILSHRLDEKDICINKEMVYRGFANWASETKHCLTENIIWQEGSNCLEYDSDGSNHSIDRNDGNNSPPSEKLFLDKNEVNTTSTEESCSSKNIDLISILANGEFELENSDFLIDFLPTEFQVNLKQRKLDIALNQLSDVRAMEYKKEEIKVSGANSQNISVVPGDEKSDDLNFTDQGPPLGSCGLFHPTIYWSQTDHYVKIKVNLHGVSTYQVDHSDQTLMFSAVLNEKYYWFYIVLFGKIFKESVKYSPKGLYFEIKLEKFIKGELWSRLIYDDFKFPWIKLDPDFIEQDDITLIESMFNKGLKKGKFTFDRVHRTNMQALARPETDSDLESVSSKSSSAEYHDMIHDALDSESE